MSKERRKHSRRRKEDTNKTELFNVIRDSKSLLENIEQMEQLVKEL